MSNSIYFLKISIIQCLLLLNLNISRYASLFFCVSCEADDNELLVLEVIHRYVEILDKYFGNVSSILNIASVLQCLYVGPF